jgi:hypothetical protein
MEQMKEPMTERLLAAVMGEFEAKKIAKMDAYLAEMRALRKRRLRAKKRRKPVWRARSEPQWRNSP